LNEHLTLLRTACTATPTPPPDLRWPRPRLDEAGAPTSWNTQRFAGRIRRRFYPECHRRAQLVGESYPFGPAALPADLQQPQLGQRHPRIRPFAKGARSPTRPCLPPELPHRRGSCSTCFDSERQAAITCSRIRRKSNFSGVQHSLAGNRKRRRKADVLPRRGERARPLTGLISPCLRTLCAVVFTKSLVSDEASAA